MKSNAELLNDCGTKLSAMNDFLAKALETADTTTAVSIRGALDLLGPAGKALAAVADSVLAKPYVPPTPALKPGQVVADVGGDATVWRGSLDPSDPRIKETDWRVFMQNYERMPLGEIFSSNPAGKEKTDDGRNFTQGDAATPVVDVWSYKVSGAIFAPWL